MAKIVTPNPPSRKLGKHGLEVYKHYYCKLRDEQGETPDLYQLQDFAYYSEQIVELQERLKDEPMVVTSAMGSKANPLITIIDKHEAVKRKLANELGIGTHTKKRMKRLDKSGSNDDETPNLDQFT